MPHQCTECGRTFDDGSKEMLSGCPNCGGNKFQFQPSSAKSEARKATANADSATKTDTPAETPPPTGAEPDAAANAGDVSANANDLSAANSTDRASTDVEQELSDPGQADGASPPDQGDDAEIHSSTTAEDRAQRDARSSPTTSEEIDQARRRMAEDEGTTVGDVANESSTNPKPQRGRGTPQGPPTEEPDEAATEEFGLDGPVGGPDEQPSANTASQQGPEDNTVEEPETDLSALRQELNDQFESIKITAPGQYELNLMELYDRKEYIISLQEDGRYVVDIPEGHEFRED